MAKTLEDYQKEEAKKKESQLKQRAVRNIILRKAADKKIEASDAEINAELKRLKEIAASK